MKVNAIPDGYPVLTPYLIVNGAAKAIEFYKSILGATERLRMDAPGGKIGHAELSLGSSLIMLADECPERGALAPQSGGASPVMLYVYVENVDAVVAAAIAAGAKATQPVETKFYGDRSGGFIDPFGHSWYVATHVEDVTPEEMQRRRAALPADGK